MATTGTITVDLNQIMYGINNSTDLAAKTVGGVAQQGDLIGLGIGIALAIGILFGAVFLVIGVIPRIIKGLKNIR